MGDAKIQRVSPHFQILLQLGYVQMSSRSMTESRVRLMVFDRAEFVDPDSPTQRNTCVRG